VDKMVVVRVKKGYVLDVKVGAGGYKVRKYKGLREERG